MQAQTSLRLLPLFTITAAGMLTVDLYLPAVPTLPADLGGTIVQAQATLAVFFATLAASQIVWGSAADKFGVKPVLIVAITLQIAAGFVCAVAPSVETLIAARGVQGFGVGPPPPWCPPSSGEISTKPRRCARWRCSPRAKA
jgi:MFS family permease